MNGPATIQRYDPDAAAGLVDPAALIDPTSLARVGGAPPDATSAPRTLATIVAEHDAARREIDRIAAAVSGHGPAGDEAMAAFYAAARRETTGSLWIANLFDVERAAKALDASSWARLLALTDVYQTMPQKRRREWDENIEKHQVPPFTLDNAVASMQTLLEQRASFFAERVDGLFRALSPTHKTNDARGFGERMILAGCWNGWYALTHQTGYIADLRAVIARFMGREEPAHWEAGHLVERAAREHRGEWVAVDGGAWRLRVYAKGTAHVEIHPDMAWRLNVILASANPRAVAAEHRMRPTAPPRSWPLIERPLPTAVVEAIGRAVAGVERSRSLLVLESESAAALAEASALLQALGGEVEFAGDGRQHVRFGYDAVPVLRWIATYGAVPDIKTHQFYPTPPALAAMVAAAAAVEPTHHVLEPSAGLGALLDALPPAASVTAIDVAPCFGMVLSAKGYATEVADFLAWTPARAYDRVVMNPPFSDDRWRLHLQCAYGMLAPGGRLVAILPMSARGDQLPNLPAGVRVGVGHPGDFAGTDVQVAVWRFDRRA